MHTIDIIPLLMNNKGIMRDMDVELANPISFAERSKMTPEELAYYQRAMASDLGNLALASVTGGLTSTPEIRISPTPITTERQLTPERIAPEQTGRNIGSVALLYSLYNPHTEKIDFKRAATGYATSSKLAA